MKVTSIRKVIHETAQRNLPLAATVVEVIDQLERRHNLARGAFDITMTGKTWKEIFDEMPDFVYNEQTESYFVDDLDAYLEKSQSKKRKLRRMKKSEDDLLDEEFERMVLPTKTLTMEEFEKKKAAALVREREERKLLKESCKSYAGLIPKIVEPIEEEEEEEL